MSLPSSQTRYVAGFILAGVLALSHAAAAEATTAPSPPPSSAIPASADLMRTVYLALAKESVVPANPRVMASAALDALSTFAPDRVQALPDDFGTNPIQDAEWLANRVADLPPPWPIFEAMVRSAATVHVGLTTPDRGKGLRALSIGEPLSSPGFNLLRSEGRLIVFDVSEGGSAHASGLRLGDVLVRVDGRVAARVDPFLLHTLPAGTDVQLDIERSGNPRRLTLRLIKASISRVETRLLDDRTAYIFVRSFARSNNPDNDTAALVRRALASAAARGARALVLDLRSALGGSGEVSIASALCDGANVYWIKQPLSSPPRAVPREGVREWPGAQIAVLVNESTTSAGEALALSLRELCAAKIIGQTTGGGLTEMKFVPLAPGYAVTIPTGVVLGPITITDQPGHAVAPDIEVTNPTIDELLSGSDRQLDTARAVLAKPLNPAAQIPR